ncbi:unnamed protein product [Mesocestoides corti]|uniref:Innexin n=1 Tax=Mesocestoides corti TaxID=53468 RepID=A0A158QT43_MESCO|nr:unnamed protein product [Mesocestoides corti]
MTKLVDDALKICEHVNAPFGDLEDFGDRFNYMGCVIVLAVCFFVVSTKQYFFNPISCYLATEAGGTNILTYVENYCWVQGTVPISYAGKMPTSESDWLRLEEKKMLYYQWVPFVLGLQCCLFMLPRLIWKAIYLQTGTKGGTLSRVVLRSVEALSAAPTARQALIEEIADMAEYFFFKSYVTTTRATGLGSRRCPSGIHIVSAYLVMKVLYLLNAIGQIFMMQSFLGFNSTADLPFGLRVLKDIVGGHDWQMTQVFPRVGFCYVELKLLGVATNAVTAQCALPLNMLNEKIYVFLWWWILAAACITAFFLSLWIFRFSTRSREVNYIVKYIQLNVEDFTQYDEREVSQFVRRYLRHEGTFLVRMVRLNAGERIAAALVRALWERYRLANESLERGFHSPDLKSATAPQIVPQNMYPQFRNFSKSASNEKENVEEADVAALAYV